MSQRDYSQYALEDFVFDEDFREWVRQPNDHWRQHWRAVGDRHPHLIPLMEQARHLIPQLRVPTDELPEAARQRIWQTLDQRFDNYENSQVKPHPAWRRPALPRRTLVAAAVAILLLAGWWFWVRNPTETIQTAYGETRTLQLPDGSVVKLNGNSSLTYTPGNAREVWLTGEAFFIITKQTTNAGRQPFVAHTPRLDITVLGTQFNVVTRPGKTAVTLVEGRIQLRDRRRKTTRVIELKPGQQARLPQENQPLRVEPVRTDLHDAWTRDRFTFDNTPLSDIAAMLTETYGLTVVFADAELAEKRFTANLSNQNLETLLTVIAETYSLHIQRTDRQVVFKRK